MTLDDIDRLAPSPELLAFWQAKRARRAHSEDCLLWDYETSDCIECAAHDRAVERARRRWMALIGS